ncbi:MAG: glycosyltransferase [Candidatus Omnitrophota bacterium]|jgi:phosphatidylinositol alpha-1,6-mannosyltransferase
MRIGVDVREFKRDTYTGLRSILRNFVANAIKDVKEHEFIFFGNQYTEFESLPEKGKKIILQEGMTFWWDQVQLPYALLENEVDVFFSPYIKTPLWRACPYVNTLADIIPLIASRYRGVKSFLEKIYFIVYAFLCSRRASKIVTLSNDSKEKISREFLIDPSKVEVVYPSVERPQSLEYICKSTAEVKAKHGVTGSYLMYVGNFKAHKNLDKLVNAFDLLPAELKNRYKLLLVGGAEKDVDEMRNKLEVLGLAGQIIPTGAISNQDIFSLLAGASLFVFPSLAEGFGIPPVEAMALGVPVAASGIAPMTEVLGDAAVFFDPHSPEDISKAINRLLTEKGLREKCIERGYEQVSKFDPAEMTKKIIGVLEDIGKEKTLFTSSEFPPTKGGIATIVYNLWKRLPKEQTLILTTKAGMNGECVLDKNINIIRKAYPLGSDILSRTFRTIGLIRYVWAQNRLRNIRCNHCAQILSSGIAGLLMKKIRKTPFVVYAYSADILEFSRNFLTKWIMKIILKQCKCAIVCSDYARSIMTGHYSVDKDKVKVLTPGVDTQIFNPKKGDNGIRDKYGIKKDQKLLITVSRLDPRKGHDKIIEALPGILKVFPEAVYMMVGGGEKRGELEALVKEKGLERNVIFTGEKPHEELAVFYNACDLFVMTPRYLRKTGNIEGFGIVFLEASACGKPVIAGKSGGVSEAVVDGVTGILVDPENAEQIKDTILKVLKDENYARRLGDNGLRRVQGEFSWESRAEELGKYT